MALETLRTLGQLKEECEQKGITVQIKGSKEHKEDYIRALRDYWLEKYYGSKDNAPWTLKFMLSIDCPMLCRRYQQCKPEQQKMFWESDDYIAEEKQDGCFHYKTPVLLSDGTTLPIGEIVEKKLSVEVMSFDESTGRFVPRKVVGWFDNGYKKASQWMKVGNLGGKTSPFYNAYHKGVFITKNHNVWSDGEWKPAGEVNNVCIVNLGMNDTQIKVMYGSVLGDGICSYSRKGDKRAYFQFMHSIKQKDYFDKKAQLFSTFPHNSSILTSGYGSEIHTFRLNACNDATLLREKHYVDSTRKITQEYLNIMGILGLAIWYMDDGSRNKSRDEVSYHITNKFSRATFSAYRYNESDVREIVTWLNSFGYESSAHMTTRKGKNLGYVIQLSSQGSQKFFRDIAPYIPKSMEYKLPENYRGGVKESWWEYNTPEYTFSTTEVSWKVFNSSKDKNITSTKAYDIEVEGCHSYVANGIIVHNSRSLILFDASTQEFDFYSRNNSVKDYLPQSYKDTIYVTSKDFHYPDSFVLDCEVISTNPNISTVMGSRGVVCATQLQATTALLALNPLESKSIQRQYPLKFIIFDCLYDGKDLIDQPWKERHPHAEKLARLLKKAGFSCDLNPVVYKNKLEFYSDIIEKGGEGCFAGFTNILMGDHSTKPIKDIQIGDIVKSYDINTKDIVNKRVTNIFYNGKKPISEWNDIYFNNPEPHRLLCTKNHLFFDGKEWRENKDLYSGFIYSFNSQFCSLYKYRLDKVELENNPEYSIFGDSIDSYDIEVEDTHCYFAEGVLVHNCVFKNKNAPYHACTSRTIDQVKLKRTISDGLNKDLDAWVSGFIPSDPNKSWSNLIGALVFSCKVRMKDGSIKDHIIGTCSGISLEFRKFATVYVDGKPSLNPDLLGKVAKLQGQNFSARKLALTHCTIEEWRPDKDPDGCEILTEEELLSLVF